MPKIAVSDEQKKAVLELPIGQQIDIKPRFCTYTIYRANENKFELDSTSDGWVSAKVNKIRMEEILNDVELFYELDWK